ncbi:MAG: glycosyltransferase, partial [Nonlabens sp.]|nr:glycosyltransferase [Nonlabens sp.]
MKISLIICTYMRPYPLSRLLASVQKQTIVPDEILIIDGSTNDETKYMLETQFQVKISETRIQDFSITYHKVPPNHRGLTKQRNYGMKRVGSNIDIVAFLDDDTVLDSNYFKNLGEAFIGLPDAAGIGGLATNENRWQPKTMTQYNLQTHYVFQNYVVAESSRNVLRNKLGLASNELPGVMPLFGHGRTFSYPLTGKNYPVDLLVGMSMAFRKKVVDELHFSTFFEGYGLYEDADFSLRALHYGQNYLATSVQLEHHHDTAGRP